MKTSNMRRSLLDPAYPRAGLRAMENDMEPKLQVPQGPGLDQAGFRARNPNAGKPLVGAMPRDPFSPTSSAIPAVSQPTSWGREARTAAPTASAAPASLRIGANSFGDAAASFSSATPSAPRSAQDVAAAENFGKNTDGPFSRNWNANGDAYAANNPGVFTRPGGPANYEGLQAQQGNQYQGTAPPPIPAPMQAELQADFVKPSAGFGSTGKVQHTASLRNGGQVCMADGGGYRVPGGGGGLPLRPPAPGPQPSPLTPSQPQTPIPGWMRMSLRNGGSMPAGNGGTVPGTGEGDKIDAKYEPGEFVVSNDMLDAQPELAEHLHALREDVLAAKGMTPAEADAKAVTSKGLRAEMGISDWERLTQQQMAKGQQVVNDYKGLRDPTARGVVSDARAAIQQPAGEAARYTSANPPRPAPPTFSGPHGDGTYGANSRAPAAAAEAAKPAGRMAKGASMLKVGAKALAPLAVMAEIPTVASTETADYAKRFGIENKDASFMGDLGIRGMGAASDIVNVGGVLDGFYADKRSASASAPAPAALRAAPGVKSAGAAPASAAAAAAGPAKLNDVRNIDIEAGTQEVFTKGSNGSAAGWTTVSTPQAKAARALRDQEYTQKLADDAGAERGRIDRAFKVYQEMGDSAARNQLRDNASWNPRAAKAYTELMKSETDARNSERQANATTQGAKIQADATMYNSDNTARTAKAAALRTAFKDERDYDLRRRDSDQASERGKQEDLDKMFSGHFMRNDDKGNPVEDVGKKALAKLEFNRATAGGNTGRKPAELQADAIDYVNLLGSARDHQNNSLWQKYGWGDKDPSLGGLPTGDQMKGAKLTTVGVGEGARTVNAAKGNYKLQLKDGSTMYFDREVMGAAQLALLKRQGAQISKD